MTMGALGPVHAACPGPGWEFAPTRFAVPLDLVAAAGALILAADGALAAPFDRFDGFAWGAAAVPFGGTGTPTAEVGESTTVRFATAPVPSTTAAVRRPAP